MTYWNIDWLAGIGQLAALRDMKCVRAVKPRFKDNYPSVTRGITNGNKYR